MSVNVILSPYSILLNRKKEGVHIESVLYLKILIKF